MIITDIRCADELSGRREELPYHHLYADGVKDVRVNVEAEPGVTGFMVEKALKEALGFSPRGDVYPIGGLPRTEGKAQRVFYKKI